MATAPKPPGFKKFKSIIYAEREKTKILGLPDRKFSTLSSLSFTEKNELLKDLSYNEKLIHKEGIEQKKEIRLQAKVKFKEIGRNPHEFYKLRGLYSTDKGYTQDVDLLEDRRGFFSDMNNPLPIKEIDAKESLRRRLSGIKEFYEKEMDNVRRSFQDQIKDSFTLFKEDMIYRPKSSSMDEMETILRTTYLRNPKNTEQLWGFFESFKASEENIAHFETHSKSPSLLEKESIKEFQRGNVKEDRSSVNYILKKLNENKKADIAAAKKAEKQREQYLKEEEIHNKKLNIFAEKNKNYKAFGKLEQLREKNIKKYIQNTKQRFTSSESRDEVIKTAVKLREKTLTKNAKIQDLTRQERDLRGLYKARKYIALNEKLKTMDKTIASLTNDHDYYSEYLDSLNKLGLSGHVEGPIKPQKQLKQEIKINTKIRSKVIKELETMPDYEYLIKQDLYEKFRRLRLNLENKDLYSGSQLKSSSLRKSLSIEAERQFVTDNTMKIVPSVKRTPSMERSAAANFLESLKTKAVNIAGISPYPKVGSPSQGLMESIESLEEKSIFPPIYTRL